ncbi:MULTISPECIES: GNAT family N-acetyltransferase [unclassified Nocardia]|uniref:GNAT family N-acetyltransferase n=1 Tax=unclassified Nocardia TaxID=2637762 RepID=UPI0033A91A06
MGETRGGTVAIRRLEPAQWAVFREVRLRALRDAPSAFGQTVEHALARTSEDWRGVLRTRAQFVATISGVTVGTVGVTTDSPAAHLISMWVEPRVRGRGISDQLITAALGWAAEHGCTVVCLEVTEGNAAAENLYRRHGFVPTGRRGPVEPGDPRLEFEMRRPL